MSDIILGQLVDDGALRVDVPTLVDTRALITGNSGAGKSRLLRRLAEQAFGKVQQIIIDPEGEFATLREKHDFLLAGRGGEVPAEPRAASLLARRLIELTLVGQYAEAMRLHPRRDHEPLVDYLERIKDLAEGTEPPLELKPPPENIRLPYKEPRELGEEG